MRHFQFANSARALWSLPYPQFEAIAVPQAAIKRLTNFDRQLAVYSTKCSFDQRFFGQNLFFIDLISTSIYEYSGTLF